MSKFKILYSKKLIATGTRILAATVFFMSMSSLNTFAQVNAEQVLNIGRNVLSMEDYLLAIQYFNLAIKSKPYLADAYYLRGLAKLSLDDFEGAVNDETLALARNKYKSEAYKVRGFALQNLGKDSLAIIDYNRGLEYNPDDKYFLFYKAVAQTEIKDFSGADSTFNGLLRRNPGFEEAFVARGRMRLLQGDTISAIDDIERALRLSRSLLNAHLLKADIFARQSKWQESLESMDEAIRLRPDEPDFYVNRAYLRYNNEDFFGAMSDYNYALQIDPRNESALFNRALLRSEVKELSNAAEDFSAVLELDPTNFHALYNRGLVNLELGNYRKALDDFKQIARRYPKFHPAYYAMAECYRGMDNIREMVKNIKTGDALVANYVANPSRNPLDRPTIAAGKSFDRDSSDESAEDFMERFNQLVTHSDVSDKQMSFNDRIKGRVQDRDINVVPEEAYSLSFYAPEVSLRNVSNYFRNLDNLNRRQYISHKIYLRPGNPMPQDVSAMETTFDIEAGFSNAISASARPRPVDYMGRGVARTMLKNYDGAIADFTVATETADDFTTALFGRAYAYYQKSKSGIPTKSEDSGKTGISDAEAATNKISPVINSSALLASAMADLDAVLKINPGMVYAWFNKGLIYYENTDYTSAIQCYDKALAIDPEFGEAYFNRGLSYMRQGNREKAFADLSKAGELGVLPSYNILKRMK